MTEQTDLRLNDYIYGGKELAEILSGSKPITNSLLFQMAKAHNDYDMTLLDTSEITDMSTLFCEDNFNQPIGDWDVSNVTNMCGMFLSCDFNQDISQWDVSSVAEYLQMFNGAWCFNQDISSWDLCEDSDSKYVYDGCPIQREFKAVPGKVRALLVSDRLLNEITKVDGLGNDYSRPGCL